MNSESQIPQTSPESDRGIPPQSEDHPTPDQAPAATQRAEPISTPAPPPSPPSYHYSSFDDMGFVCPPEMPAEPDYDGDFDYDDHHRERELLMDDLADDNEDFSRSNDEGWFYSDED